MSTDFTIVTPSFNSLSHLQRAVPSIRDQRGVRVHHLVIDACSSDGTAQWLAGQGIEALVEPDEGMYDAINKGLDRARGEFVAYLNCDEQYLPGTLARVKRCFDSNPHVDVVYGGCLITRTDGSLLSVRHAYPLRYAYVAAWQLYIMTASIFLRRRVIDAGLRFDKRFRVSGDCDFVLRLLKAGHRAARLPGFLSSFAITGKNLSGGQKSQRELALERAMAPAWARALKHPLNAMRIVEKALAGGYRAAPVSYECYTEQNRVTRTRFDVPSAPTSWPAWEAG